MVRWREGTDKMLVSTVLMLVMVWVVFNSIQTTGFVAADSDKTDVTSISQCSYEKGATLYVSDNCGECREQEDIFGEDLEYIKIVDCEDGCKRKDVKTFPTWVINGKKYHEVISPEELGMLTGCLIY